MRLPSKRDVCLYTAVAAIALLLVCELFKLSSILGIQEGSGLAQSIDMAATRLLGGIAFLAMIFNLEYRIINPIKKPFFKSLLFSLPAFLIAVNNFPFSTVIKGEARVTESGGMVLLLLLECLAVGFFEETAFRGVVFLGLLKKDPKNRLWAFASIAISSAVFGLVHLINLFEMSPGAVLMQIGYSALIGAMCAVLLMKTANIWLCVLSHGLFNFCGAVIPRLGEGRIWDGLTIALTAVLSLAVTGYMVFFFIKDEMPEIEQIYENKSDMCENTENR